MDDTAKATTSTMVHQTEREFEEMKKQRKKWNNEIHALALGTRTTNPKQTQTQDKKTIERKYYLQENANLATKYTNKAKKAKNQTKT